MRLLSSFLLLIKLVRSRLSPAHLWIYNTDKTQRRCTVCDKEEHEIIDGLDTRHWCRTHAGKVGAHDPQRTASSTRDR